MIVDLNNTPTIYMAFQIVLPILPFIERSIFAAAAGPSRKRCARRRCIWSGR